MTIRGPLTEQEKIQIIENVDTFGRMWTLIGSLLDRNPDTIRSFYDSYLKHRTIFPARGRPRVNDFTLVNGIIGSIQAYPTQRLIDLAKDFDICESTAKKILNENNIKYFEKTPITPLTQAHKDDRVNFTGNFALKSYRDMPNIIFSDECLVETDLKGHGIWRVPGDYPDEAFYERSQHPTSVMIWGAIGPYGYQSELLKFDQRVNSFYYCSSLINNKIFLKLYYTFGRNWVWQEDNAPPHRSQFTKTVLKECVPSKLIWPARSPDLSPIEQIWQYMKKQISCYNFNSKDQLFFFLRRIWNSIPKQKIHNYYSSFLARCKVCHNIKGESLNGHWSQVKDLHNEYRTDLFYQQDPLTFQFIPLEIQRPHKNSKK